jgi:TatD DNase family protein
LGWIDVHTHLNFLKETPEEAMRNAQDAGVDRFITIGTEPKDHEVVLELARKYYPVVMCTLGVHPHEAKLYTDEVEQFFEKHLPEKVVAAVGEIGLDYYYKNSEPAEQKEAFRRQLALAARHKLPVEIHTRDAEPDTDEILFEVRGKVAGLLHCFTGTKWLAAKALDHGFDISISGVVTFKNADDLRDVVRMVPLDRLHVETDAPFLSPVPMRGRPNVPAHVVHTAKLVAELKGVSVEDLQASCKQNARRLFTKLEWT